MPTQPDLTPWPALLEAVAKRWPDAPRIPMGLVNFHRKNEPFIRTNTEIGDSFEAHRYMADAVLIRWATEFEKFYAEWWMAHGCSGQPPAIVVATNIIDTPQGKRGSDSLQWKVSRDLWSEDSGPYPTLLSAHAAAVGAIVGGSGGTPKEKP